MKDKAVNMKHEFAIVIDKVEKLKCKMHNKTSEIKFVGGRIQINSCCEEHRRILERKIEYEMYTLLNENSEEKKEEREILKQAV